MIDKEKLLQESDILDVIGRRVELKKNGANFLGFCPFHEDSKPSLTVSPSKQIFKCFPCGKAGNSIDFLMDLGMDFVSACDEISNGESNFTATNQRATIQKANRELVVQFQFLGNSDGLEKSDGSIDIDHFKFGKPSGIWAYRNLDGKIDFYTCRFDLEDGTKEVYPYSYVECIKSGYDYVKSTGEPGGMSWSLGDKTWRWMGMSNPRILYNLYLIQKYPKATILMVEGEKCADHANKFLNPDKTIAVSWVGGANGVKNSDFSVLKNRNVIYWRDNDTAGITAMQSIHSIIKDIGGLRKWINIPENLPNKWDVADQDWTAESLRKFILDNIGEVPKVELPAPETKLPSSELVKNNPDSVIPDNLPSTPKKPTKKKNDPTDNNYFRMLGYDKNEAGQLVYFFFSHDAKSVIKLSPSSMTKSNLIPLANLNYWEEHFPGGGSTKINMDAVQQFLIGQSHRVGIFRDKSIRGRGAWDDNGEIIIHSGNQIIKSDRYIKLRDYTSDYVYEIGENLGFEIVEPLKKIDAAKLIEKISWLTWEREINAYLLAGWCVIAPFCGVLNWRPHIWLTGPSGSGKSYVMTKMIRLLMGRSAIIVQGKTTEPALRGLLQSDARPILFDESDVEDQHDKDRIQSVLSFGRSASDKDGASTAKGTKEGGARTSESRACLALSSVGVQLNSRADKSRFTVLGLRTFEHVKTAADFTKFALEWDELVSPEFVTKLHYRTIRLLPTILKNSIVFGEIASQIIENRRLGDQLGSMLAGAYSLVSDKLISHEKAKEWLMDKDWSEEKSLEQQKDEAQLFSLILGTMLKVELDGQQVERTVGELISMSGASISCFDRLRRAGIIVTTDRIFISNTAKAIKSMIYNTPWAVNHNKILERIEGSIRENPRDFYPGHSARSVSLPLELVVNHSDNGVVSIGVDDELPF